MANQVSSGARSCFKRTATLASGRRVRAKLYDIWDGMHKRCYTPSNGAFYHYGAKGVRVVNEWHEYPAFRAWAIATGFRKGLTLDRINNGAGYGPGNCRWATREEQTYNSSRCHSLTLNGVTKLLPIWAKELGVTPDLFRSRRSAGWTDEQILTIPAGKVRPGMLRGRAAAKAKRLAAIVSSPSPKADL